MTTRLKTAIGTSGFGIALGAALAAPWGFHSALIGAAIGGLFGALGAAADWLD